MIAACFLLARILALRFPSVFALPKKEKRGSSAPAFLTPHLLMPLDVCNALAGWTRVTAILFSGAFGSSLLFLMRAPFSSSYETTLRMIFTNGFFTVSIQKSLHILHEKALSLFLFSWLVFYPFSSCFFFFSLRSRRPDEYSCAREMFEPDRRSVSAPLPLDPATLLRI